MHILTGGSAKGQGLLPHLCLQGTRPQQSPRCPVEVDWGSRGALQALLQGPPAQTSAPTRPHIPGSCSSPGPNRKSNPPNQFFQKLPCPLAQVSQPSPPATPHPMPVTTLALSPVSRFPGPHQHPASHLWLRTCGGASELRAFSLGQGAGNPHIICLVHSEPRDTQQAPGTSQPDRQPRQAWKADVGPPGTPASPSAPPGPEGTETPPPCFGRVPRCSNCFRRGSVSGGCFRHCDAGLTTHPGVSSGAGWRRGCQEERPGLCTPDLSGRACAPKSLQLALTPTLRPRAALSAAGASPPDLLECVFSRDSCWHSPGSVSTCVLAPLTAIVTCQAGTHQGLCGSHHTLQQGLPGATER